MNAELFTALELLEKEKGIPAEYMIEKIEAALISAYKKEYGNNTNVRVMIDPVKKDVRVYQQKEVVETVENPETQISLEDARAQAKKYTIGSVVETEVKPKNFRRLSAAAAKSVIIQGIREAERGMIYEEFNSKEHEILTGVVNKIDPRTGCAFLKISSNSDYTEAMLAPAECIRGEELHEGDRIKVYVVEVRNSTRGPQVLISRTHPGLVKRLFELEVPEIFDGTVEIKSIAREAGSRTKMAVWAEDPVIDPIGACVGPKGGRVASVVNELGGE